MNSSMGYFICTINGLGNPWNCKPVDAPRTMEANDMLLIIGSLWSAIAIAYVFRLIAIAIKNA